MRTWSDWQAHNAPIGLGGIEVPGASRQFGKTIDIESRDVGGVAQYEGGSLSLGFYGGVTLVSRVTSSLTEPSNAAQDLVGRFMPHERFWRFVGDDQITLDGRHQFSRAAMHAPANLLVRQLDKPSLHQVEPRGAGGREMDVIPRALR